MVVIQIYLQIWTLKCTMMAVCRPTLLWSSRKQWWRFDTDFLSLPLFPSLSSFPFPPPDWEEEQVSSPNILRLIFQGRFLHGNVTLGGENNTPSIRPPPPESIRRSVRMETSPLLLHLLPEGQNRGGSVLRTNPL